MSIYIVPGICCMYLVKPLKFLLLSQRSSHSVFILNAFFLFFMLHVLTVRRLFHFDAAVQEGGTLQPNLIQLPLYIAANQLDISVLMDADMQTEPQGDFKPAFNSF